MSKHTSNQTNTESSAAPSATFEQKQQELELVLAIDHIRDTLPEPSAMLTGIANVLADQFQANLCLLCLLDRETGTLELKAINDRRRQFDQLAPLITREVAQQVVNADGVAIWKADAVLPKSALAGMPDNLQLAAVPIILEDRPLGALLRQAIGSSVARSLPATV
jgi:transcriptional regulator with GAF, ATPase, and Fis domain